MRNELCTLVHVVHHQFLLLEFMFTSMFTYIYFLADGQAWALESLESGNLMVNGPLDTQSDTSEPEVLTRDQTKC